MKLFFYISAMLLFSSTSSAEITKNEFAKCASIEGDLSRLECFDKLAEKNSLNGKQSQKTNISGKGKWNVDVKINPVDDSKTVVLSLDADSGHSKWGEKTYLVLRCRSNETDLYIGWNDYLGSKAEVLTRIGKEDATTMMWNLSTDKKATFYDNPIPFIKRMLGQTKLLAQTTPYNESPATAIFDISGIDNAIKPLRETCNW